MLSVKVVGAAELAAKFGRLPNHLHNVIVTKVNALAIMVADRAKNKVSGEVLKVQTGNLRANIFPSVDEQGTLVIGRVAVSKTVPYAAIHEFGGIIQHPGGTAYFIDAKSGAATFVSNKAAIADRLPRTKPHAIPMPERSYLRSSLDELSETIRNELAMVVLKAVKE